MRSNHLVVRYAHRHRQGVAADGCQFLDHALGRIRVGVGDDDARAFRREPLRVGAADAGTSTSHDQDLVLEPCGHAVS
jgi:hypothetical protein